MPDATPSVLFVSPHLDDVAFSCAATLARLGRLGWPTALATVFTRSVPNPTGFALACQLDKHLPPEVDYLAIRRAEDADFARALGVHRVDWLDLPEAPHRGYESAPALFAGVRPDDTVGHEVADRLAALVAEVRPAWVFAPRGVGNHADHLQVIRAVLARRTPSIPVAWYRDLPYASRFPDAPAAPDLPGGLVEVAAPLSPADRAAKLRGCLAYRTQVPFQFGGEAAVESVLGGFADREGFRLGLPGPAESFLVDPAAVAIWHRLAAGRS